MSVELVCGWAEGVALDIVMSGFDYVLAGEVQQCTSAEFSCQHCHEYT